MVDPKNQTTYSGMLPGIVAGHYNPKEAQMNLAQIANKCTDDDIEYYVREAADILGMLQHIHISSKK